MYTKESLIAFTDRVRQAFLNKHIAAPVHLCGGNEEQLIEIFKEVRLGDWVFSTWRSAHHALLKGIPEEWVFNEILMGRSMYLMNKEYRFMAGSIVGGMLPIALGVAAGIKMMQDKEDASGVTLTCYDPNYSHPKVWVFVGDMAGRTGIYHEFRQYAAGHGLPVNIVIEDNGLSTNTPTLEVWGTASFSGRVDIEIEYKYERTVPHVGIGQHVSF